VKITAEADDRADKVLARRFPEAGRRRIAELFDEGCVKIGGRRARKGDRIAAGEVLELSREPLTGEALRPVADEAAAARLAILIERSDIVVVAKPAGMPSQPLRAGELGTAAGGIAARFPECAAIGDDPRDGGLVHRLDIGTSGVLVAARTVEAYRALREAFGAGAVDKQYLAITDGRPVARECEAPLAQRGKRAAVDHTEGLAAHTLFTVERAAGGHALVRCAARTGRMHQVRAHLAYSGAPITGDVLYGGAPIAGIAALAGLSETEVEGFFLHAARIELPLAGGPLVAEAPEPERFARARAALGL
jgi:23S rRNA pseudouridine1911/1915/1917 synthase